MRSQLSVPHQVRTFCISAMLLGVLVCYLPFLPADQSDITIDTKSSFQFTKPDPLRLTQLQTPEEFSEYVESHKVISEMSDITLSEAKIVRAWMVSIWDLAEATGLEDVQVNAKADFVKVLSDHFPKVNMLCDESGGQIAMKRLVALLRDDYSKEQDAANQDN